MSKKYIIYHYTKFESALKIIESENIRFSAAAKTNDPFEFGFIGGSEERRKKMLESTGIFCASLSKDNILMLSHYSKNIDGISHAGCVLEFEFSEELNERESGIEFINLVEPDTQSGAMGYSNQVPDLRDFFQKIENIIIEGKKKNVPLDIIHKEIELEEKRGNKAVISFVGTKKMDWKYEEEVRFLVNFKDDVEKQGYGDVSFKECALKLKAVYYGCRVLAVEKSILEKIASHKNIEVKAAIKPDFRAYE